jgi:hypothetical protein
MSISASFRREENIMQEGVNRDICEERHLAINQRVARVETNQERLWRRTDIHADKISFLEGRHFSSGFWGALIGSGAISLIVGIILFLLSMKVGK